MSILERFKRMFLLKYYLFPLTFIFISLLILIQRQEGKVSLDREIDGAVPKCVPHSELMTDEILRGANLLNNRGANKTKFIPLAAFSYGDYTMVTTTADGYYGPQYSSVVFPNFAVHCCTQHDAVYMSVTLSPTENIVKFVNVTERKPGALKYNMSVCLAPLYGNESKWMYLVQLFEHYKLQGVVHFYVYIHQIDEYSEKLLLDYEKTEEVELVYFDGNDRRPAKNWQFVALQDCIGRSKHESKFVTVQDLDELLMSTQERTLLGFANETLRGPVASVSVHPYIIIRTSDPPAVYEGMETLLKHLPALIFQNSSARTYKFRIKSIFKPATVIGVLVHWVYLFEPGYTSYNSTMDEVFILHFRNPHEFGAKYMHILDGFGPFTARSYPDQFMSRLIFAIKGRLDCIYNKHY